MRQQVIIAIFVMTITMILTEPTGKPVKCLHEWSECGLLSEPCCHKTFGNRSSLVIKRYCDYLGTRVCVTPDNMYRYEDSRHIEELKDNEDFQKDYNYYLQILEKIQRHLDLKHFTDRMFSSGSVRKMYRSDKL